MQKDVTTSWGRLYSGRRVLNDISSTALIDTDVKCEVGVTVRAASGNGGTVYIGNSDVTKNTAESTDGYELAAGQTIFIQVNNVKNIYGWASVTPQTVYWIAV